MYAFRWQHNYTCKVLRAYAVPSTYLEVVRVAYGMNGINRHTVARVFLILTAETTGGYNQTRSSPISGVQFIILKSQRAGAER